MTSKIRVHAHLRLLYSGAEIHAHALTGPLYLQIGEDEFFPFEGATTVIICVLGWWIDNAMRLLLPDSDVDNITMDSSAYFRARRAPGTDDVTVRLYDSNGQPCGEYIVSYRRYLASLRGAAKGLLNEIDAQSLTHHSGVEPLREHVAHIQRLEERIKTHGLP
jgi:hypothetical protein